MRLRDRNGLLLSTSVVTPSKVVGRSLKVSRLLKTEQSNAIDVRESPEDLVAVEIATEPLGLKLFFVGSLTKALKTTPKK